MSAEKRITCRLLDVDSGTPITTIHVIAVPQKGDTVTVTHEPTTIPDKYEVVGRPDHHIHYDMNGYSSHDVELMVVQRKVFG